MTDSGEARAVGLKSALTLLAITVAGFAIRFVNINQWPLWGDEGQTLLIAQWPVWMLYLAPVDPTPGLYYTLHKLFLGPAAGVIAARSISLLCGMLLKPREGPSMRYISEPTTTTIVSTVVTKTVILERLARRAAPSTAPSRT